jgi:hypothetical protein
METNELKFIQYTPEQMSEYKQNHKPSFFASADASELGSATTLAARFSLRKSPYFIITLQSPNYH